MRRIEIYINSKGALTIDVFRKYEDENIQSTYNGHKAYEVIKNLASKPLKDVVENRIRDNISLEYKDYIVILNEPDILINRRGLGPLINSLQKFYEEDSKKIIKNKKITRKNKYTGKKIIAAGLAVLVIGSVATNYLKKEDLNNLDLKDSVTYNELYENPEANNNDLDLNFINTPEANNIDLSVISDPEENNLDSIFIEYEDRSYAQKTYKTKAYYGDLIEKYSKQYGLDPNLVLGIAIQERGIHSEKKDLGGATGLMQIQNSVWENEYITAYNYETQKQDKMYITNDKIKDINNNIKIGCMYLQNCMKYMDNNVIAAVQSYNMGCGNVKKVLNAYSRVTNKSVQEILEDTNDMGWLDYRKMIDVGDQKYVEHVFSWLGTNIEFKNKVSDNTYLNINIVNRLPEKNISFK